MNGSSAAGGRVLYDPIKGSKCAMILRAEHQRVSCSPSSGCRRGGLKFRHDVQEDNLPACRLEGPATDLVPQKSYFEEQDHRDCDENSHVHRTRFFLRETKSRAIKLALGLDVQTNGKFMS